MKSLTIGLMLATALLAPAAAHAQSLSTSTYRSALETAECIVANQEDAARAVLAGAPGSPAEADAVARARQTPGCAGGIAESAVRGALAERLYLRQYPSPPADTGVSAAPFAGSGDPELARYDITRCAAIRDPFGADALIRSILRSSEERTAITRIMPVIAGCVPAGTEFGMDREMMRGMIAEGLVAVRAAPAPGGT